MSRQRIVCSDDSCPVYLDVGVHTETTISPQARLQSSEGRSTQRTSNFIVHVQVLRYQSAEVAELVAILEHTGVYLYINISKDGRFVRL